MSDYRGFTVYSYLHYNIIRTFVFYNNSLVLVYYILGNCGGLEGLVG